MSRLLLSTLVCALIPRLIAAQSDVASVRSARIVLELDGGSSPFFRVSGLAIDENGTIFVAERSDDRVRAFHRDGVERAPVATAGSGPREVRSPCCLAVTQDGHLVIRDNGNARFVLVRVRGGPDSSLVLRQRAPAGNAELPTYVRGSAFADAGWIEWDPSRSPGVYRIVWISTSGVPTSETTVALPTWDSTTTYSNTYGRNGSRGERFAYPLFGRRTIRSIAPDGRFATAQSDRYAVELREATGRPLRRIDRAREVGPQLTAAERDSSAQQIQWDARRLGVSERSIPWSIPARKPPIRHLEFDGEGNLWVERHVQGGAENVADVYDRKGDYLHSVRWPPDVRIRGFPRTLRRAIGVRVTENGESVVVLEFP